MKVIIAKIFLLVFAFATIFAILQYLRNPTQRGDLWLGIASWNFYFFVWTIPQIIFSFLIYRNILLKIKSSAIYFIAGILSLIFFHELYGWYMTNYQMFIINTYSEITDITLQSIKKQIMRPKWLFYLPFNLYANFIIGKNCRKLYNDL